MTVIERCTEARHWTSVGDSAREQTCVRLLRRVNLTPAEGCTDGFGPTCETKCPCFLPASTHLEYSPLTVETLIKRTENFSLPGTSRNKVPRHSVVCEDERNNSHKKPVSSYVETCDTVAFGVLRF